MTCYLNIDREMLEFTWRPELIITPEISYEVNQNIAILRRSGHIHDQSSSQYIRFGERLVLDLDSKSVGLLEDSEAWQPWRIILNKVDEYPSFFEFIHPAGKKHIQNQLDPLSTEIHLHLNEFNHFMNSLPADLKQFLVMANNTHTVQEEILGNIFKIHVQSGKLINYFQLSVSIYSNQIKVGQNQSLYEAFAHLKNLVCKPGYKPTRTQVLNCLKKFFLDHQKEATLRAELNEIFNTHDYPADYTDNINDAVETLLSLITNQEPRHEYFEDNHYLVKTDYTSESTMYLILWESFPDLNWNEGQYLSLSVHKKFFYEKLSQLQSLSKAQGIQMIWDESPLETMTLSMNLSVTKKQDWFSLHPEIFDEGKLINQDTLKELIENQGMIKTDNVIKILDQSSLNLLEKYVEAFSDVSQSPLSKKSYVELSRLQIFDILSLKKWGADINLPKEYDYYWKLLNELDKLPKQTVPKKLKGKLRDYQKASLDWLSFLFHCQFGACLADDMGLGKTVQTIAFLAAIQEGLIKSKFETKNKKNKYLVVVPPSLKYLWQSEIDKFYPGLSYIIFAKETKKSELKKADIIITTYDMIRRHIDLFLTQTFTVGVFDEAQMIKNLFSGRATAARQLNIQFKLCLTGTPIENHLGEYFSIMDFVVPGLLQSYKAFQKYVSNQTQNKDYSLIIQKTSPFILRRTKDDILKELPQKTEQDIVLEMSAPQKKYYTTYVKSIKKEIKVAYQSKTEAQANMIALTAILRLRQVCITPYLVDNTHKKLSPKCEYLIEQLKELEEEGHSAIVFSQFRTFLVYLEKLLKEHNIPVIKLDGQTPSSKRRQLIDSFQESKKPLFFLISLKAGGVGLNLTKASYVYHMDPWWNPAVEEQASSRVHRIGQTQKVFISKLMMRHSIEEKMNQLKAEKKELINQILTHKKITQSKISLNKKDFEFILDDNNNEA